MSKMKARAAIVHFDDAGRTVRKPVRTYAMLCIGQSPQVFDIPIPDKRRRRFTNVQITRAEIERVLADNPND